MNVIMKLFCVTCLFTCVNVQFVFADDIDVSGKYFAKNGSELTLEKTTEKGQYRITGKSSGDYYWEGIGFYSKECQCIKSVFRYTSHKDKYGDNCGYHKFMVKNNGNTLINQGGGWNSLDEFGKSSEYTRKK
ncbi:hypothetical protein [Desulfobacter sp.]|uniref:hypothetical protein n=1 Tax=Desulfobacter sp. TaxID=2294 RepID=UPI003D111960